MRIRGFEVVSGYADKDIQLPKRQTCNSAGYDLAAAEDIELPPKKIALVPTGIKAFMPSDEYLAIFIRSSQAIRRGLTLANGTGIIDADYYNNIENEGHILIALYNHNSHSIYIRKGERIAQGIFNKYFTTDDDAQSVSRKGGIGSTSNNDQ